MKTKLILKHYQEIEYPQEIIDDAPLSGPFDDYADYLYNEVFEIETTLEDTIKILSPYGAWDDGELQNLEDNIKRILWVTICDCKEQETTWTYLGE